MQKSAFRGRLTGAVGLFCLVAGLACAFDARDDGLSGFGPDDGTGDGGDGQGDGNGDGDDDGNDDDGGDDGDDDTKFDVPGGSDDDICKVVDDSEDGYGPCEEQAPPDSFDPEVQWTFEGEKNPAGQGGDWDKSDVTPLVANFTDDDQNGEIDLCDVPDVLVVGWGGPGGGYLYLLDGETGALHYRSQEHVGIYDTPVIADIDDDGIVEVVTTLLDVNETNPPGSRIVAFENDLTIKWISEERWQYDPFENPGIYQGGAMAAADLDNDGDVEIMIHNFVIDHEGELVFRAPIADSRFVAPTAHDLDGDGDLEVLFGPQAYHHDGVEYFNVGDVGFPAVGDVDNDGQPEVILTNTYGITLLEHDGTVTYSDVTPTGDASGSQTETLNWIRPVTIHDFDGDTQAEFAMSSAEHYTTYEGDASIVWSSVVADLTGGAAGTAFDFLGDGTAEAMYADEKTLYAYDAAGSAIFDVPRSSWTLIEYPVVADVDNDGSAEIVVVSGDGPDGQTSPMVQVIRDREDRWVPARRIWNQHTYHVTNVREDGTIPQFEKPHWQYLNTFRTQAQIENGGACEPEPQG